MNKLLLSILFVFGAVFFYPGPAFGELLQNLRQAAKGDYIVTAVGKNTTVLHIYDRKDNQLIIEEVTVPAKAVKKISSWKDWIKKGAPQNTSWVQYAVDLTNGKMLAYYSLTKNAWFDMSQAQSFLTTLLNLRLTPIPDSQRKKVGVALIGNNKNRALWQPSMVVDGKVIPGVEFDAWRTQWPKDKTELDGKTVEVYIPKDSNLYPAYFPYWLEISGMLGNAKIRIIDSGTKMVSPAPPLRLSTKR